MNIYEAGLKCPLPHFHSLGTRLLRFWYCDKPSCNKVKQKNAYKFIVTHLLDAKYEQKK